MGATLETNDVFNFPCEYPIKVFGQDNNELAPTIFAIIEKHTHQLNPKQVSIKRSSKGRYSCLTVRIIASSKNQIDCINKELQQCPLVAYVL